MSAKDLNFSLDRAPPSGGPRDRASRPRRPATSGLRAVREPGVAPAGKPAPARGRSGGAWLAATIALANMAFLVLAGLWLSGIGREPLPERPAADALADATSSLHAVQAQLGELRREVTLLQAAVDAQRQLLVAAHLARTDERGAAGEEPGATAATAAAEQWYINLGHFATRPEAAAQQEKLASLGYTGSVVVAAEGANPFALRLPGFPARAAAEEAANDIMGRTDLNGLWVTTGD